MLTTPHTSIQMLAIKTFELMESGERDDFVALIHPNAYNREAYVDEPPAARERGPAGFHTTALWLRDAFEDLHWQVHEVVVQDDLAVAHATMSGRHVRPFVAYDPAGAVDEAFPPTGRRFATTQTHWLRFAGPKLIEHWANRDDLGTAKQLGWVPPSPLYLVRMALARRAAVSAASAAA